MLIQHLRLRGGGKGKGCLQCKLNCSRGVNDYGISGDGIMGLTTVRHHYRGHARGPQGHRAGSRHPGAVGEPGGTRPFGQPQTGAIELSDFSTTDRLSAVKLIEDRLKTVRSVSRSYPAEEPSWGYHRLETGYVK